MLNRMRSLFPSISPLLSLTMSKLKSMSYHLFKLQSTLHLHRKCTHIRRRRRSYVISLDKLSASLACLCHERPPVWNQLKSYVSLLGTLTCHLPFLHQHACYASVSAQGATCRRARTAIDVFIHLQVLSAQNATHIHVHRVVQQSDLHRVRSSTCMSCVACLVLARSFMRNDE